MVVWMTDSYKGSARRLIESVGLAFSRPFEGKSAVLTETNMRFNLFVPFCLALNP
jgi:hypothetical protein